MTDATPTADFAPPADTARRSGAIARPDSRMFHSRLIGGLFLTGFLFYGTGAALISSIVGVPDFLKTIGANQSLIALGAVLMLLPIITDLWRAVVYFPVVGKAGRSAALTYFGAQVVSVVMFFVGVLGILLIVPISQYAVDAAGADVDWAMALGSLMVNLNEYAYQISQIALTFGSLALWIYGYRVRLIPRAFAGWGLLGYVIHMGGCIAELFGVHVGMMTMIPGALFEITLPFWLFFKGFNPAAYGKESL